MDWDQRYETGDTPWDKGRAHPSLAEVIGIQEDFAGAILVPGCGRGWDVRDLALRFPAAVVTGVDLSVMAIGSAAEVCKDLPNVRLKLADFLNPESLSGPPADLIWEHTCFCALSPDRRAEYVASCARMLAPGGRLVGLFFLNMDDAGSGPPWNTPEDELQRLFERQFEVETPQPVAATFKGREGEERLVRMTRRG